MKTVSYKYAKKLADLGVDVKADLFISATKSQRKRGFFMEKLQDTARTLP